jgi:hypothetical protein
LFLGVLWRFRQSVQIVERLFLGVLGLAALITRFYFTGRR